MYYLLAISYLAITHAYIFTDFFCTGWSYFASRKGIMIVFNQFSNDLHFLFFWLFAKLACVSEVAWLAHITKQQETCTVIHHASRGQDSWILAKFFFAAFLGPLRSNCMGVHNNAKKRIFSHPAAEQAWRIKDSLYGGTSTVLFAGLSGQSTLTRQHHLAHSSSCNDIHFAHP